METVFPEGEILASDLITPEPETEGEYMYSDVENAS